MYIYLRSSLFSRCCLVQAVWISSPRICLVAMTTMNLDCRETRTEPFQGCAYDLIARSPKGCVSPAEAAHRSSRLYRVPQL